MGFIPDTGSAAPRLPFSGTHAGRVYLPSTGCADALLVLVELSPAAAAFQQLPDPTLRSRLRLPGWLARTEGHFRGHHGGRVQCLQASSCPAPEVLSVKQEHLLSINFPASAGRPAPSAAAAAASNLTQTAMRRQWDEFWTAVGWQSTVSQMEWLPSDTQNAW